MSNLTAKFDIDQKPGELIRIQAAAVKNYRGGAAAIIAGTGYATPLVVATAGMQFIGVYSEGNDNSNGVAGTINNGAPLSGLSSWVRVFRTGIYAFNQSGLTQANVGERAYFSDDNTVSLTASAVEAGIIVTIDEANSLAYVDIKNAVMGGGGGEQAWTALAGSTDAIPAHNAGNYIVTTAGVDAMTLAAPTAIVDDNKTIVVSSNTANAHTITATGLLQTGGTAVNVATFAAHPGAGLTLKAYNGKWQVIAANGITFS